VKPNLGRQVCLTTEAVVVSYGNSYRIEWVTTYVVLWHTVADNTVATLCELRQSLELVV